MVLRRALLHTGVLQQVAHRVIAEAGPAMRQSGQQIIAAVLRQVDDDQLPARPQNARHLGQHPRRVLGVVQHHLHHRDIERRLRQRQAVHVRQPHRAVRQPGTGQARARQRQHRLRGIDADALADPWRQQFQNPAGPGADIQQPAGVVVGHQREQRGLDRGGGKVERPHLIPVGALAAEALGRHAGAFGEHAGGLAAVGLQDRVVLRQAGDQFPGQRAGLAVRQGEPDIGALTHPVQQAAVAQQLQVAGQARLRLAEDLGELRHAEGAAAGQRQQAEAGRFSGGAQAGQQAVHRL